MQSAIKFVKEKQSSKPNRLLQGKWFKLWTWLHYHEQNDSVVGYIFLDKTKFYSLRAGTMWLMSEEVNANFFRSVNSLIFHKPWRQKVRVLLLQERR